MDKKDAIVLVADAAYLDYARQVCYSAHRYGNWKGDYVLLVCDCSNADLSWFTERGVHVYDFELLTKNSINGWPPVIFHKFYLLHPMMKRWRKLIYLDTDIMVLKDINHLTKLKGFAASPDHDLLSMRGQFFNMSELRTELRPKMEYLEQKYNLNEVSFNVGMMVFDPRKNSMKLFHKALKMLEDYHAVVKYPEQAIFNLFFYKKWKRLSNYNNYYNPEYVYKQGVKKNHAVILHFIGNSKPWHQDNIMYRIWVDNLKNAQHFPEIEQVGIKPHNMLLVYPYAGLHKWYMLHIKPRLGHFSWWCGQRIKRLSPAVYKELKRILG